MDYTTHLEKVKIERRKDIVRLLESGWTDGEIMARLGCSRSLIYSIKQMAGLVGPVGRPKNET